MTWSGFTFDRDAAQRTNASLWSDIDAHARPMLAMASRGQVAIAAAGGVLHDGRPMAESERVYLGQLTDATGESRPVVLHLVAEDSKHVEGLEWVGLRDLVGWPDEIEIEIGATAIALSNWRSAHRLCPDCGSALVGEQGGWVLSCPNCGRQVWPRTDPAVIVLVTDERDRVLLGSNAAWEQRRYSLLAGFVEPGENLESAVVREVFEESGIRVASPRYVASQAWPFPASLMIGFTATAQSAEPVPDGEEILDVRWFDRDEICAPDTLLPRRGSLARTLLERWFGGPIPEQHVGR